jgi:hypothetical protein
VDGTLFLVAGNEVKPVAAGQKIARNDVVRTGKDSGAVIQLADGSRVEMRERSELSLDRASDGVSIRLERGSVIVSAAKQRSGHLYVATEDCTISVVGTVFSVNSGTKGSRVSVLEGEVHVEHGSASKALLPGQQLSTNPVLGTVPLEQDIAWSRDAEAHRALLRELAALSQDLGARIAASSLRHTSTLIPLVPEDAFMVASLPNLTDSFGQAYETFRQRIRENPVLRPWWEENTSGRDGVNLDDMIGRVRKVGTYLGPEIIIAVPASAESEDSAVLIAEAPQPAGLSAALADLPADASLKFQIGSGLFVASGSAAQVERIMALRRQSGQSGFASTRLYTRIENAYRQGVGWLLAADLERILSFSGDDREAAVQVGLADAQQLLIEQKTGSGDVAFHATLGFNQPRRGMVSWLAEPASMGALDFVSANAYGAAGVVVKEPVQIMEDLLGFLQNAEPAAIRDLNEFEQQHRIDVRHDLAAPLGGEFLFALDGPLLPTPSWKVIVEVYDAARLQNTIQWLVSEYNREAAAKQWPALSVSSETVGGRTFYALRSSEVSHQIHYTFWSGYLIATPNRTLLSEAIQYKETGNSLGRAQSFRSQIPADGRDYISGFFYQNMSAASSFVPAGLMPTLICLYGESDRITLSSKGVLGMNLASLGAILEQVQVQ